MCAEACLASAEALAHRAAWLPTRQQRHAFLEAVPQVLSSLTSVMLIVNAEPISGSTPQVTCGCMLKTRGGAARRLCWERF